MKTKRSSAIIVYWFGSILLYLSISLPTTKGNDTHRSIAGQGTTICPWPLLTSDNCTGPSLQYVLENYEQFFTSHTTIELLPGLHEVNVSVGSVVVRNIVNFTMIGAECNDGVNESCTEIVCTEDSAFGLAFINVEMVTLSNFHTSNCSTRTGALHREFQSLYDFDLSIEYLDIFAYIYTVCREFVILFTQSHKITLDKLNLEQSKRACLIAIGVYGLNIERTTFKISQCLLLTPDSNVLYHNDKQKYSITDSTFMHSFNNVPPQDKNLKVQTGLYVEFHHINEQVEVIISNVTVQHGNVKLTHNSKRCTRKELVTSIAIEHLTIIGKERIRACFGFVQSKKGMDDSCYKAGHQNTTLTISHSQFIQSNVILGLLSVGQEFNNNLAQIKHPIQMRDIEIESVPCQVCLYSLFVANVYLVMKTGLRFTSNCSPIEMRSSIAKFYDGILFCNNRATFSIHKGSVVTFSRGSSVFANNSVILFSGSVIHIDNSTLHVTHKVLFINNTGKRCGGILATTRSKIIVSGPLKFIGNKGSNGGAMALYDHTTLEIEAASLFMYGTSIQFIENSASHNGGALFIDDTGYQKRDHTQVKSTCAVRVMGIYGIYDSNITLVRFINNTVSYSGSALYGGWIDICNSGLMRSLYRNINVVSIPGDPTPISSKPSRVCVCEDSIPQCNITHSTVNPVFPGQSLHIEAVAVGQRFGTVPAIVMAEYQFSTTKLSVLQQFQGVSKRCTQLDFTISTHNSEELLLLKVDQGFIPQVSSEDLFLSIRTREEINELFLVLQQLYITIPIAPCPLGYQFDNTSNTCVCHNDLLQQGIQCDISRQAVLRAAGMWINATFDHTQAWMSSGVIVHHHCPLDYCRIETQYIDLEYPSDQCNFNRSGILCGSCGNKLSHIFGTSKCGKCSSLWAILVVPTFLLLGLGLVALLTLLNLTVTQGTINALIFYANIVRANQAIFFTPNTTNTFLSWFVAWINLDVGIEVCFFNGLNAYTKTWLQFLFPFYIWILVITIIVSSRYSTTAARLSGTNAVQVLATLFLLSYAKLLRVIITTFSSTVLVYPNGYTRRVWVYDGNVDFLEDKHIALFVAALLLLVFISFPYTVVLFFIQWLQHLPPYRVIRWIWRLKPLFDAHVGLYRDKHRYWTGLLLLVRVSLFLLFSLNIQNDPALNLLATVITCICLFAYLAFLGGVHKSLHLDILEYLFLLNLGILSAGTFYTRQAQGNQDTVIKLSVSVAFITFLILVLYHVYLRVKSNDTGSKVIIFTLSMLKIIYSQLMTGLQRVGITKEGKAVGDEGQLQGTKSQHTKNTIELRESLLVDH